MRVDRRRRRTLRWVPTGGVFTKPTLGIGLVSSASASRAGVSTGAGGDTVGSGGTGMGTLVSKTIRSGQLCAEMIRMTDLSTSPAFRITLAAGVKYLFARNSMGLSEILCLRRVNHHEFTKRSLNMMANCVFASDHSRGGRFHSAAARLRHRYSNFVAASSVGKWPLVQTARRSLN